MLCKKMALKRKLDLHKSMTVSVAKVLFLAFCTKLSESREAGRSAHIKPELGGWVDQVVGSPIPTISCMTSLRFPIVLYVCFLFGCIGAHSTICI